MEPFLWLGLAVTTFIAGYLVATIRAQSRLVTFHTLIARGESFSSAWNETYGE